MTKKEFEAIGKQLLPDLPSFAVKGQLLLMRPVGHTLRGIFFDRSIDPGSFYTWIFVKPLFIPSKHISFNIGWRLRRISNNSDSWNAGEPNLIAELSAGVKREAMPFFARVQSPKDVANVASSIHPIKGPVLQEATYTSGDTITQQAIAYALARAGDSKEAENALDRLIGPVNEKIPWQHEMADRARTLKLLLATNPVEAQRQLDAWEAETAKNLGLEKFR